MNFKLKALVAAVAFAAAGSAFADIQAGNNAASSPNGELVFFAYGVDSSNNVYTYVKDLGVSFNTFLTTPSYAAVNLALDSNWATFNGTTATDAKYWGIFATQKVSSSTTAAGAISLLTTANNNDVSGVAALSNTKFTNAFAAANNAIVTLNVGGTDYAANSSYFFAAAPVSTGVPAANIGAYLGSDFSSSGVFINSTNVLATNGNNSASFFDITRGAGSAAAGIPTVGASLATWTLNNNVLAIAAVPEPETYAMMAAGLLMLGAVARRRRA